MEADGPSPGIRHMLRKGSGREPHGDAQEDAPSGASKGLQNHVVEGIQDKHQQAPIEHRSTAQAQWRHFRLTPSRHHFKCSMIFCTSTTHHIQFCTCLPDSASSRNMMLMVKGQKGRAKINHLEMTGGRKSRWAGRSKEVGKGAKASQTVMVQ